MLSEAKHPYRRDHSAEVGYELLFRDGVEDFFRHTDADAASRSTLNTAMLLGLSTFSAIGVEPSSTALATFCSRITSLCCHRNRP
jgi:hypothetical protein